MNDWQILRQLKYLLQQRKWTGSSTVVFNSGSVKITVGPDEKALASMISPICLLRPLETTSDPEHDEEPDLVVTGIVARLIVCIPGDPVGENALIGANRAGQTSSKGRGLFEIEEELFNAVEKLNDMDGVRIQSRAKGAAQAVLDDSLGYIAYRDYQFESVGTADRYYHAPRKLAASLVSGGVYLTWALPPTRYDTRRVILRRAAGSTPPATATGGTGVTLSGSTATSVTDSPGSGTWSYAVFEAYSEYGSATDERVSEQENGTTVSGIVVP